MAHESHRRIKRPGRRTAPSGRAETTRVSPQSQAPCDDPAQHLARAALDGELGRDQRVEIHGLGIAVAIGRCRGVARGEQEAGRSEEHTSELQSLMRISYADFCLQLKKISNIYEYDTAG